MVASLGFLLENFLSNLILTFTVNSLFEIADILDSISKGEYAELINNSKKIGDNIRNGYYLKTALDKCERKL